MQFCTLFFVLGGLSLYLLIMTLNTSLTCVDELGCLLEHCVFENFSEEYKTIIDIALSKRSDCPYALGTSRQQNLRSDNSNFVDYNVVTCQPSFTAVARARQNIDKAAPVDLTSKIQDEMTLLGLSNQAATPNVAAAEAKLLATDFDTIPGLTFTTT